MKKHYLLSIIVLSMFVSSCVRFITPAITGGNNIGYLPRPVSKDSNQVSKTYISGEFLASSVENEHLAFNIGMLNISRGYSNEHINFGFGAFTYLGNADYKDSYNSGYNNSPILPDFNKSLYGWGVRSTIGLHTFSDNQNFNFRIINWENAFSAEYGEFATYRKALYDVDLQNSGDDVYISNRTNIYTTGLSSEVIWADAFDVKNLEVSLRLFIGFSPGLSRSYKNISNNYNEYRITNTSVSTSTYIKYNHIYGVLQVGGDKNFGSRFALGYSF